METHTQMILRRLEKAQGVSHSRVEIQGAKFSSLPPP